MADQMEEFEGPERRRSAATSASRRRIRASRTRKADSARAARTSICPEARRKIASSVGTQPFLPFDDEAEPARDSQPLPAAARRKPLASRAEPAPDVPREPPASSIALARRLRRALRSTKRSSSPRPSPSGIRSSNASRGRVTASCSCGSRPSARSRSRSSESELAREGRKLLSRAQALALVEQACGECFERGSYFGALKDRPGFHRAIQNALDELRAAGVSPDDLPARGVRRSAQAAGAPAIPARVRDGARGDGLDRPRGGPEARGREIRARRRSAERPHARLSPVPDGLDLHSVERRFVDALGGRASDPRQRTARTRWSVRVAGCPFRSRARRRERDPSRLPRNPLLRKSLRRGGGPLHRCLDLSGARASSSRRSTGFPCTFREWRSPRVTRGPGRAALAFLAGSAAASRRRFSDEALASGDFGPGAASRDRFRSPSRAVRPRRGNRMGSRAPSARARPARRRDRFAEPAPGGRGRPTSARLAKSGGSGG